MTKNFIHFIETGFARRMKQLLDWWDYRLRIFKNFTLKSLLNQSNRNFYLLMHIDNFFPLTKELEEILIESGIRYVITNDNIKNDFEEKIQVEDLKNTEYVYVTRIDSDDLFRKDVVEEIQEYEFEWRRALVFQKGYCYNCVTKKLQHYKVSSPPNPTIMYPKEIFIDTKKHKKYTGELNGHDEVFRKFDSKILSENKYMILIHEKNIASQYLLNNIGLGRIEILNEKHEEILKEFGISSQTYEKI